MVVTVERERPRKKLDDELLTMEEVAEMLRMPLAALRKRRVEGKEPAGFRFGKRVLYRRSVVEAALKAAEEREWR